MRAGPATRNCLLKRVTLMKAIRGTDNVGGGILHTTISFEKISSSSSRRGQKSPRPREVPKTHLSSKQLPNQTNINTYNVRTPIPATNPDVALRNSRFNALVNRSSLAQQKRSRFFCFSSTSPSTIFYLTLPLFLTWWPVSPSPLL